MLRFITNKEVRNMRTLLRFNLMLVLVLASALVSASTININPGTFKFTGDSYIDTQLPGETRALGRITTISQGTNIIWNSGDLGIFLTFLANGIAPVVSPTPPLFNFVGTGGFVQLFSNTSDVIDTTLSYDLLSPIIAAGGLFLDTSVNGDIIGTATNVSYSANGFLDSLGGEIGPSVDTNARVTFDGGIADLSFGLVGTNNTNPLVSNTYQYITSADVQGSVVTVPAPAPLALMGLGLIVLGLFTSRNKGYPTVVA